MICKGGRVEVTGGMTMAGATALLAEGIGSLQETETVFDLSAVSEIDSSGLAVVFGWIRAAREKGLGIRIENPPKNLLSLAEVYGVADLLPVSR